MPKKVKNHFFETTCHWCSEMVSLVVVPKLMAEQLLFEGEVKKHDEGGWRTDDLQQSHCRSRESFCRHNDNIKKKIVYKIFQFVRL